jgi:phenylpropionate dioxygenase-like ring-hydroxylating dioxygenase large terminal subunit
MDDSLIARIKADMRTEFARTGPPDGFPAFPEIPAARHTDDAFFEQELEHVFGRSWLIAGRAEDAPNPGDYFTCNDLRHPVVVVRGNDSNLRAYYNTCQHRGAPVVRDAKGSARRLRCQYHSWTYDIDSGKLVSIPDERDFVDLDIDNLCLPSVQCDVFAGFVFVNLDRHAQPPTCLLRSKPIHCARCTAAVSSCRATGK